jgi:hypothetical protein
VKQPWSVCGQVALLIMITVTVVPFMTYTDPKAFNVPSSWLAAFVPLAGLPRPQLDVAISEMQRFGGPPDLRPA